MTTYVGRHRTHKRVRPKTDPYPTDFIPAHIGPHCRHALFMRGRNTTVPTCFGPPEPGSLYCVTHATGKGTEGGNRTRR